MISGIVRVEFLNQQPSFSSKTHQDLEAQHGDVDLIASFYHDYLLFIIHDRSLFIVKRSIPNLTFALGIILCYSVGAGEARLCSATISFVHKQNCSNLPMVMSDKHLLNQGATCRIGGYLAGMWQCCLTTCTTRAQIDIALPEDCFAMGSLGHFDCAHLFIQLMRHWNNPSCHTEDQAESKRKRQAESVKFAHLVAVLFRTSNFVCWYGNV